MVSMKPVESSSLKTSILSKSKNNSLPIESALQAAASSLPTLMRGCCCLAGLPAGAEPWQQLAEDESLSSGSSQQLLPCLLK